MAQDYKYILPEILSSNYSNEKYMFMHTNTQRTKSSCLAFVEGLNISYRLNNSESYGDKNILLRVGSLPKRIIPLLLFILLMQPNKYCNLKDDLSENEYKKFQNSTVYQEMVKNVSLRLGFDSNNLLSSDTIDNMWTMCRFDLSWNVTNKSAWCAVIIFSHYLIFNVKLYFFLLYKYRHLHHIKLIF